MRVATHRVAVPMTGALRRMGHMERVAYARRAGSLQFADRLALDGLAVRDARWFVEPSSPAWFVLRCEARVAPWGQR